MADNWHLCQIYVLSFNKQTHSLKLAVTIIGGLNSTQVIIKYEMVKYKRAGKQSPL